MGKLSNKKNAAKEAHKRELSKERSRRFRERLKNDPERLEKRRESDRIRRRKNYGKEKEHRQNNPKFEETCRAVWREEKRKVKVVTFEEFVNEMPKTVKAQRRRRSLERKNVLLAKQDLENQNNMLKKKVKVLQTLLARKRHLTSNSKNAPKEKKMCKGLNEIEHKRPINGKKVKQVSLSDKIRRRQRNTTLKIKRGKYVIWQYRTENFLSRDHISRPIPGATVLDRRQTNTNRKDRQKKGCPVTKRVLRYRMKDLFKEYIAERPDYPYKFSTFSKMKPKHIVTAQKGTQKQKCICVYHANLERKLIAINKFCNSFSLKDLQVQTVNDLSNLTLCDYTGSYAAAKCLERTCSSCSADKIMDHFIEAMGTSNIRNQTVYWTEWSTVDRMKFDKRLGKETKRRYSEVVRTSGTFEGLLQATIDDLQNFPMHDFKSRWQWKQLHALQENLPKNDIICIMDFSENISMEFSEETISSHAKCFSVTLFPVVIYHNFEGSLEQEAVCILSDDMQHDSHMVRSCMDTVMSHLKNLYPQNIIETVHRYSDGCAAQFRSRHCMRDLSSFYFTYNSTIVSNYGETSEFKNVCDGLGDHIKTTLRNTIIREDLVLSSPLSYYEYLKENMTFNLENREDRKMIRRSFYFIHGKDVDRNNDETLGKPVNGLLKVRSVRGCKSKGFVELRNITCNCEFCLSNKHEQCLNKEYVDCWNKKHVRKESGCCTIQDQCQELEDAEGDEGPQTNVEEEHFSNSQSPCIDITNGSYVAVVISGRKSSAYVYMAKVIGGNNDDFTVEYMERAFGGSYIWRENPESSEEPNANIYQVSEPRKISERGHLMFDLEELESVKSNILKRGFTTVIYA